MLKNVRMLLSSGLFSRNICQYCMNLYLYVVQTILEYNIGYICHSAYPLAADFDKSICVKEANTLNTTTIGNISSKSQMSWHWQYWCLKSYVYNLQIHQWCRLHSYDWKGLCSWWAKTAVLFIRNWFKPDLMEGILICSGGMHFIPGVHFVCCWVSHW